MSMAHGTQRIDRAETGGVQVKVPRGLNMTTGGGRIRSFVFWGRFIFFVGSDFAKAH